MTRRRFTLVELLVAVMITAIVVPVAIGAMMSASRAGEDSRRYQQAAVLADNKLRELVATDDWRDAADRGDFGDEYPTYIWTLATEDWVEGDVAMRRLTLTVYPKGDDTGTGVSLSTLVPEEEAE